MRAKWTATSKIIDIYLPNVTIVIRRSEVQYWVGGWGGGRGAERVFMEKFYRSSKWWEVKDWGERVSELVTEKKQ